MAIRLSRCHAAFTAGTSTALALLGLFFVAGALGSCGTGPDAGSAEKAHEAGVLDGAADVTAPHDAGPEADGGAEDSSTGPSDGGPEASTDAAISDAACGVPVTTPFTLGTKAASAGFSGTTDAYSALYGLACTTSQDCATACEAAGGTTASCVAGSSCAAGAAYDGGIGCLPPVYWFDTASALMEVNDLSLAGHSLVVPGGPSDSLLVSGFGFAIPSAATIDGVALQVRRAAGLLDDVEDQSLQLLVAGAPAGANRAAVATTWPITLTYATYGGANDLWGTTLTPVQVDAATFGVAIMAQYTGTAGDDSVYIDSVRVAVTYTVPCP